MDTTTGPAIVRNRLLAGKCDSRDYQILKEVRAAAAIHVATGIYARILVWAISNAMADMDAEDYRAAAFEVNLVHNLRIARETWLPSDEEYFIKGEIPTYMENAPVR